MFYTVQPGDTLWAIAARFGTSAQAIMQANRLRDPNAIYPGLRLWIPVAGQIPGDRDLERRVTRLERQVERLSNEIDRHERRLDRLEGQAGRE